MTKPLRCSSKSCCGDRPWSSHCNASHHSIHILTLLFYLQGQHTLLFVFISQIPTNVQLSCYYLSVSKFGLLKKTKNILPMKARTNICPLIRKSVLGALLSAAVWNPSPKLLLNCVLSAINNLSFIWLVTFDCCECLQPITKQQLACCYFAVVAFFSNQPKWPIRPGYVFEVNDTLLNDWWYRVSSYAYFRQ